MFYVWLTAISFHDERPIWTVKENSKGLYYPNTTQSVKEQLNENA